MELNYFINEDDIVSFHCAIYKGLKFSKTILITTISMLMVSGYFVMDGIYYNDLPLFMGSCFIFAILMRDIFSLFSKNKAEKYASRIELLLGEGWWRENCGEKRLTIQNKFIKEVSMYYIQEFPTNLVTKIEFYGNIFILEISHYSYLIIPFSAFKTAVQKKQFLSLFSENIISAEGIE